jgi:hypothetical protein
MWERLMKGRMNVGKVNERKDEWSKGKERKDESGIIKV